MRRTTEVLGLVVAAVGIVLLDLAGVPFPVVPPGVAILLVAAALVVGFRTRWTDGLGALVGLFILVGFLASGTGVDNLSGDHGALGVLGQGVEVVGAAVALVVGARLAVRREHPRPA